MSARTLAAAAALVSLGLAGCASSGEDVIEPGEFSAAWFGLVPPVALANPEVVPPEGVKIPPAIVPAGETEGHGALTGERVRTTVETVIEFAADMRAAGSQMWGRIAGLPSQAATAQWLAGEFDAIGLKEVKLQSYKGAGDFWWPDKWEARVLADPAYGDQTIDVVLTSAMPVSRSMLAGPLEAPVIFAGDAGEVSTDGVAGKIAIQHTRPAAGAYSDRTKVRESSQKLMQAGAVAVITWVEQAGNMHVFDFGQCGGPCFNVGGADGRFLTEAIKAAKDKGAPDVRVRLMLQARNLTGLAAANVLGLVEGQSDEIIIVNAHLDSWFDGAGDNADGVGVLVALARYFANQQAKPARTLLFVGSGGHHSSGMNGPASVVAMNQDLMKRVKLVVNLEHLAQFDLEAAPTWKVDPAEEPKNFGVSNSAPFLSNLVRQAAQRYGFVIRPEIVNTVPGDLGGYAPLNVARIQGIHSGPLYHTSGDVLDSISTAGLEKAARFYAYVIEQAAKAPEAQINPPTSTASPAP
jgi:hypothetical protein